MELTEKLDVQLHLPEQKKRNKHKINTASEQQTLIDRWKNWSEIIKN